MVCVILTTRKSLLPWLANGNSETGPTHTLPFSYLPAPFRKSVVFVCVCVRVSLLCCFCVRCFCVCTYQVRRIEGGVYLLFYLIQYTSLVFSRLLSDFCLFDPIYISFFPGFSLICVPSTPTILNIYFHCIYTQLLFS